MRAQGQRTLDCASNNIAGDEGVGTRRGHGCGHKAERVGGCWMGPGHGGHTYAATVLGTNESTCCGFFASGDAVSTLN